MNPIRRSPSIAMSTKRLTRLIAGASLAASVVACSAGAALAGADPFIGEISYLPYTYCPQYYAEANGQLLPIQQNAALYSLLGNRFGGNGTTNFGLPAAKPMFDASGARLIACIALSGIYPSRP